MFKSQWMAGKSKTQNQAITAQEHIYIIIQIQNMGSTRLRTQLLPSWIRLKKIKQDNN